MVGHYVRPSNFELVQLADAIVVATPTKSERRDKSAYETVSFQVNGVLKGTSPKSISLLGLDLGKTTPSDPNDIRGSHPEGHMGPCNRYTLEKGKPYVLFLSEGENGAYHLVPTAFSRVSEDYSGDDSLWMRVIKTYIGIQQKHLAMAQIDVLQAKLAEELSSPQSPYAKALAVDIVDHLRSRSPYKPTEYLVAAYETLESGQPLKLDLRPVSADAENSVAQQITDLWFPPENNPSISEVQEQKLFVLRSIIEGDHPTAAPIFEKLSASPQATPQEIALVLTFFAKHDQYRRAFTMIESIVAYKLAGLSRSDAGALLHAIAVVQQGDTYGDGKERWRSDPYVASVWPEMALSLYWFQHHVMGGYLGVWRRGN